MITRTKCVMVPNSWSIDAGTTVQLSLVFWTKINQAESRMHHAYHNLTTTHAHAEFENGPHAETVRMECSCAEGEREAIPNHITRSRMVLRLVWVGFHGSISNTLIFWKQCRRVSSPWNFLYSHETFIISHHQYSVMSAYLMSIKFYETPIETGLRASIIAGWKLAKCWGGGERRWERREAGYKLTAGLGTRTKKIYERDKWVMC
jgi:hypothetical protein